jgi:hypothetical protein
MWAPDCVVCGGGDDQPLCNLYSVTKGQQAIRELARAMRDRTGNLPPLYGIFPEPALARNREPLRGALGLRSRPIVIDCHVVPRLHEVRSPGDVCCAMRSGRS